MKLHLVVLSNGGSEPSSRQCAALYSCQRNDFWWNDDFTAFRAIPLQWWDDASYLAYQVAGLDDYEREVVVEDTVERCSEADKRCDDGIPF